MNAFIGNGRWARTIAGCLVVLIGFVALADEATGLPRLRVLTYNIHHGEGTDEKFDYTVWVT